ncbi:hypothetical protein PDIDSM_474 [Penicillium digitatum]|nr:hypothetical protein PDIDSM_474 [Penicillium digitatum]
MGLFDQIPDEIPDGGFAMIEEFKADNHDQKVNLSPGIYRDENAKTWVLPSVKQAKVNQTFDHDISPQLGYPSLVSAARQMTFSDTLSARVIISMQTIAGTGANHFIAQFLSETIQPKTVWLSDPSWENHPKIWAHVSSAIEQRTYPYYDYKTSTLDIEGLTFSSQLDSQGFATGDADHDAWPIRHFATRSNGTLEFAVAQSFSKNFGLYGERIGALHIVALNEESAGKVEAVLKKISRAEITSTPSFGAKIVASIFHTPELKEQWCRDLKTMSSRLGDMRKQLYDGLMQRNTPGNWGHLLTDVGMFSMMGLSQKQVVALREKFHIYLLPTGRLSFTGLTQNNVEYVAESIHQVMTL